MTNAIQTAAKQLLLIGILALSSNASAWPFHPDRPSSPDQDEVIPPVSEAAVVRPTLAPASSVCEGMTALRPGQADFNGGYITQNLTHRGMSLEGVPNAYQGQRLRFGSCSMSAALTQLNGYAQAHHVMLIEAQQPPFYKLGTLTPRRRAMIFRTVGEADEAVEDNFNECHPQFAANAEGMATCLVQKLGQSTCFDRSLRYQPCAMPKVQTFDGSLEARRAFIKMHFGQPDATRIAPLTFPWDTRIILGPPQVSDADVKLVHVSALIGRRLTPQGRCEVLIRNSWGTCSHWNQQYPVGSCDNPGKTDDVWVDSDAFLRRSGELTFLAD